MLRRLSPGVTDLELSAAFYDAALAPLDYAGVWLWIRENIRPGEPDRAVGYGLPDGGDKLTLKFRNATAPSPGPGFHLAFAAPDSTAIAAFHR